MQASKKIQITEGRVARMGLALADWSESGFPTIGLRFPGRTGGVRVRDCSRARVRCKLGIEAGRNFWTLVPFTMQMVMIIIGGYVVASTPLVRRANSLVGGHPEDSARRDDAGGFGRDDEFVDFVGAQPDHQRLPGARDDGAHQGNGLSRGRHRRLPGDCSVWALGLSSSAAMLMATKSALPPPLFAISGLIPLTQTLFLWQSMRDGRCWSSWCAARGLFLGAIGGKRAHRGKLRPALQAAGGAARNASYASPASGWNTARCSTILVGALLLGYLVNVFRDLAAGSSGGARSQYL